MNSSRTHAERKAGKELERLLGELRRSSGAEREKILDRIMDLQLVFAPQPKSFLGRALHNIRIGWKLQGLRVK